MDIVDGVCCPPMFSQDTSLLLMSLVTVLVGDVTVGELGGILLTIIFLLGDFSAASSIEKSLPGAGAILTNSGEGCGDELLDITTVSAFFVLP